MLHRVLNVDSAITIRCKRRNKVYFENNRIERAIRCMDAGIAVAPFQALMVSRFVEDARVGESGGRVRVNLDAEDLPRRSRARIGC